MAYDLHGSWDGVTGMNAPLYASDLDVTENQRYLNVDKCIKTWMEAGAPTNKLVLGLGVYGRSFTLASASNNRVGAPTAGNGLPGEFTREAGMLGYNEVSTFLQYILQKELL